MNQVVKVKEEYRDKLPAVTHVDGSARVQTVYKYTIIHDLLTEFEKLSGYPILLNTSFNVKDKTMVLTPKDAVDTFFDTDMDILVMGNYVMYKN
jgi:carbamoyltransferase